MTRLSLLLAALPLLSCELLEAPELGWTLAELEPALELLAIVQQPVDDAGVQHQEMVVFLTWPLDSEGRCKLAAPLVATLNGLPIRNGEPHIEESNLGPQCVHDFGMVSTREAAFGPIVEARRPYETEIDVLEISDGRSVLRVETPQLLGYRCPYLLRPADDELAEGEPVRIGWSHADDVLSDYSSVSLHPADGGPTRGQQIELLPHGFALEARIAELRGPAWLRVHASYRPLIVGCEGAASCIVAGEVLHDLAVELID